MSLKIYKQAVSGLLFLLTDVPPDYRRRLHIENDFAVLGYTIDYLSPWAGLWEGPSYSSTVKHIFPNQLTAELSFAYYDKSYVDVIEFAESGDGTFWRDDQLTTMSLSVSRPVLVQDHRLFTPTVHIGYRQDRSSTDFFDCEDVWASIALKFTQ